MDGWKDMRTDDSWRDGWVGSGTAGRCVRRAGWLQQCGRTCRGAPGTPQPRKNSNVHLDGDRV